MRKVGLEPTFSFPIMHISLRRRNHYNRNLHTKIERQDKQESQADSKPHGKVFVRGYLGEFLEHIDTYIRF